MSIENLSGEYSTAGDESIILGDSDNTDCYLEDLEDSSNEQYNPEDLSDAQRYALEDLRKLEKAVSEALKKASPDAEVEHKNIGKLVKAAKSGDEKAKDELIVHYSEAIDKAILRPEVMSVLTDGNNTLTYEDLYMEGVLGILCAIDEFGINNANTPFTTAAISYINRSILTAISSQAYGVEYSVNTQKMLYEIKCAHDSITKSGKMPTAENITKEINRQHLDKLSEKAKEIDLQTVKKMLKLLAVRDPLYLDANKDSIASDEGAPGDVIAKLGQSMESEAVFSYIIEKATSDTGIPKWLKLSEREIKVLKLYHVYNLTGKEIGAIFNFTPSRAWELKMRAERKFRRIVRRVLSLKNEDMSSIL